MLFELCYLILSGQAQKHIGIIFSGVESETTKVNQNEAATHLFVSLADCYAIEMSTGTAIEK